MMKYHALAILLALPLWACADKPGDSGTAAADNRINRSVNHNSRLETSNIKMILPVCMQA